MKTPIRKFFAKDEYGVTGPTTFYVTSEANLPTLHPRWRLVEDTRFDEAAAVRNDRWFADVLADARKNSATYVTRL
jgi:hypothetical protein